MHTFLQAQAAPLAAQVGALRTGMGKATQDEQDIVEQILNGLDFAGWSVLVSEAEEPLRMIFADSGTAALKQLADAGIVARAGLGVEAVTGAEGIVSAGALAYARERAAELVGMRYDELGRLVPNPNAVWQIADSTREYIRADVTQALQEGWSNDQLAGQLRDSYGFSSDRAMRIARTETQLAGNGGAIAGYRASGAVDGKQWLTAEDDLVTPECEENGNAGPNGDGVLALDDVYPSGDSAPPAHPNCRCSLAPWIDWTQPPTVTAGPTETEE